jgi:putative ABC transport system permease protein
MGTFLQDLRFALRQLRQSPGFTAVAVATLAVGIGANAAIFSVADAALLSPLPYAAPDRLVQLGDGNADGNVGNVGFATFQDLRDRNRSFASLAAIRMWLPTLTEGDEAERLSTMRVSANFFDMLGARPALGRGFVKDEDRPDTWRVVILSHGLWARRFGSDPAVIGRRIRMNDLDFQVVGVMAASFEELLSAHFYQPAELWAPLGYDASLPNACRSCQHLKAIGRLREGVTPRAAREDLDRVRAELVLEHPSEYPPGTMAVVPLSEVLSGSFRPALSILGGAVGLVLLIACANVSSLLLGRSLRRRHEMSVRAALGASRGRLVRQLLVESLVLGAIGGALGVGLASAAVESLARMAPVTLPRADRIAVDLRVLVFAALASAGAAILFGIAPALRAATAGLAGAAGSASRTTAGPAASRLRAVMVAGELALALVLLCAAGLALQSLGQLLRVPLGFHPDGVLTLQLSLGGNTYAEAPAVVAFEDRLLERVRALPGVSAAALAGQIPLGGNGDRWGFHIEGRNAANPENDPSVERYSVTPDYFAVMGIPIQRGRGIAPTDDAGAVPVVVVSASTARALWPGQNPLGSRVRVGGASGPWRTIVGVAGDVRHASLAEVPGLQMYMPQAQVEDGYLVLTVRGADPASLAGPLRRAVHEVDPAVPIYGVATMGELVERAAAEQRFFLRLLGAFAGFALALSALGLYGVVAYAVAERRKEIGIRVALGAGKREILRLVLAAGAATVGLGLAAGLAAALLALRLMRSLLFGVSASDPATLAVATLALATAALAAHWVPVRRALRIDPASSLRAE